MTDEHDDETRGTKSAAEDAPKGGAPLDVAAAAAGSSGAKAESDAAAAPAAKPAPDPAGATIREQAVAEGDKLREEAVARAADIMADVFGRKA